MGIYDDEEISFFQKNRVLIVGGIITVIAFMVWFCKGKFETSRARQDQKLVMIDLPPPAVAPPPPPPTAKLPPPPMETEQKMIAQEPMNAVEAKPDDTPPGPAAAVGTSLQGDGADGFGLRTGKSFFGSATGNAENRGPSSRWGWYANQVQGAISQALQSNPNTRTADFRSVVKVWADRTGRITRAIITGTTGNGSLDNAITNEVLAGLILQEPPPEGMPMPIVLRLTARHSHVSLAR